MVQQAVDLKRALAFVNLTKEKVRQTTSLGLGEGEKSLKKRQEEWLLVKEEMPEELDADFSKDISDGTPILEEISGISNIAEETPEEYDLNDE